MKSLVIAEKPSVARDIARVLHCNQKGNGICEMGYGDSADDAGEDETRGHPSDLQTISGS